MRKDNLMIPAPNLKQHAGCDRALIATNNALNRAHKTIDTLRAALTHVAGCPGCPDCQRLARQALET